MATRQQNYIIHCSWYSINLSGISSIITLLLIFFHAQNQPFHLRIIIRIISPFGSFRIILLCSTKLCKRYCLFVGLFICSQKWFFDDISTSRCHSSTIVPMKKVPPVSGLSNEHYPPIYLAALSLTGSCWKDFSARKKQQEIQLRTKKQFVLDDDSSISRLRLFWATFQSRL